MLFFVANVSQFCGYFYLTLYLHQRAVGYVNEMDFLFRRSSSKPFCYI